MPSLPAARLTEAPSRRGHERLITPPAGLHLNGYGDIERRGGREYNLTLGRVQFDRHRRCCPGGNIPGPDFLPVVAAATRTAHLLAVVCHE